MFKRKSKGHEDNKTWYSLLIMSEKGLSEEEFDELSDEIAGAADNISMASKGIPSNWDSEQMIILKQNDRFQNLKEPIFIINEIKDEEISEAVKEFEKKHKWKKFFGLLGLFDYMKVEDKVILDFKNTVYISDDTEETIEFLKKQDKREK